VTVPDGTPAREAALRFLEMMLDAEARARMTALGLVPVMGADRAVSFGLPADVARVLDSTSE
jgi:hypothetical protein